jgi:hypothetical protein
MWRPQLLYSLLSIIWAAYFIRSQISFYLSNPGVSLRGPVLCILVFVVFPIALGYLLLFRTLPWLGRLVRR